MLEDIVLLCVVFLRSVFSVVLILSLSLCQLVLAFSLSFSLTMSMSFVLSVFSCLYVSGLGRKSAKSASLGSSYSLVCTLLFDRHKSLKRIARDAPKNGSFLHSMAQIL